ncbi:MAG: Uncharacterised protein [Cellvibrionales bacterium UBA7375]|nr:MAG: Uncharacterised protein [Cellvibrionales bacterium UBA7375]
MEAVTPNPAAFIEALTSASVSAPLLIVTLPPVAPLFTEKIPLDQVPNSKVIVPLPTLANSEANPSKTIVCSVAIWLTSKSLENSLNKVLSVTCASTEVPD